MYTLKKEERLCNKGLIDKLYHNGSSFLCYPYRISWLRIDMQTPGPVQILFAVSKKRFKKAVDRNLIKRRMREAYRLNKQRYLLDGLDHSEKSIICSVNYIGKEITDHIFAEKKMIKLLVQFAGEILK